MREQGRVVWLHFNAAHAGARRWLAQSTYVLRRLAMHLRRHFAPVRSALHRLLLMPGDSRGGIDADVWRAVHDDLAFAVDEASGAYERAKLLQEELSSRLAEATNRNLYVLTMWTIILREKRKAPGRHREHSFHLAAIFLCILHSPGILSGR